MTRRSQLTLELEQRLRQGGGVVAGIDEVGKGAWAGPLVVGVAVLPDSAFTDGIPDSIADSKVLSERSREAAYEVLSPWCRAWSTGWASAAECDHLGMAAAQRLALHRALDALDVGVDVAVVDGNWDFVSPRVPHVEMRVKADRDVASVAAASILAKVTRDRHMRTLADSHLHWAFDTNKGYPCARHRMGLNAWGPSVEHRTSWAFMDTAVPWSGASRRKRLDAPSTLF
ncbi:MAG: ribonuclease HII [Actinomycetota bacterium]|nr:ribonuclease HII [Actinomycetota bacterium]MDA3016334.1 ribonuclease HII [Actinomycetota bacterium]MDA3027387.1 ribonuclease HII [Actinomycetota bacterium]